MLQVTLWGVGRTYWQGKQPLQRAGGGEEVMHVGNSGWSTLAEVAKRWGVVGGQVPKTCIKGSDWGAPMPLWAWEKELGL